jgi:hypothetical protein
MVVPFATSGLSARYEYRSNTVIVGPLPQRLDQTPSDHTILDDVLLEALEELDAIQAYDAAMAEDDEAIPLAQARAEIERVR